MGFFRSPKGGRKASPPSTPLLWRYGLSVVAVIAAVAGVEIVTEQFYAARSESDARVSVATQLGTLRARLEGTVQANAQLVRGMVASIAIEPKLSEERFTALASHVFQAKSQLRNLAAAPDLVIRFIYPLKGNEAAIGLNYRENAAQREAAELARDVGEIVLAGPVDLVQGGRGLIGRIPVFVAQGLPDAGQFWGLVSAVIDIDKLYGASGLADADLPIEVAIRGLDALGPEGAVFFGRADIFGANPVLADVLLPHGSWRMAAVPMGGWPAQAENVWAIRLLFLMAGMILVAATIAGLHLLRQRELSDLAVQQSEAHLRSIMDNAPATIFLKDREGRMLAVNETYLQYVGMTRDQVIGRTAWEYHPTPLAEEIDRHERLVKETGEPQTFEVTRLFRGRGEMTLMLVRFPVVAARGEIIGVGGIGIDVTDRTLMERQLIQAQKMEAVGQLTGGIAHDFNNLLQVIEGNLSLARMDVADAGRIAEFLDNAIRAGRRGAVLTQNLLAYSRKQTLRPQRIRLRTLIEGLLSLLSRTLGEDIRIETTFGGDPVVLVDENGLTSSLLNLAINARAAMPRGGTLTLAVAGRHFDEGISFDNEVLAAGDYVEIVVADTGTGMPEEVLRRAFEPFFTTKDVGEGSGLGLSMVYGFTRQSGGSVTIESAVGEGTTVRLLLPLAIGDSAPIVDRDAEEFPENFALKVLLVEDDVDVRGSTSLLLESLGCQVVEAATAEPVLGILERERDIGLLVSDVVLPGGKNGIELAKEAKRLRPDLKVILVSGYPEGRLKNAGLADTGFRLVSKPYSVADLSRALGLAMAD